MAASYPESFLSHLRPCLFVAGLEAYPAPAADVEAASVDPFIGLATSLRRAFGNKRGFQIWDPSRGTAPEFHAVLVSKNARFPPRKADSGHSPISPLSPGSPLHPDGLMVRMTFAAALTAQAPLWIRKHRELLPCVFVLVLRLWEPGSDAVDPLASGAEALEAEERAHDAELVREIAERKRVTSDRGIKLAVVLLASRQLLDAPELDARLSLLRRQAGLDARASLFVLSPLPSNEVAAFVASLRAEIFPAAVDYYREHGRRARRKRSRVPTRSDTATSLSPQAWSIRYEYKSAAFAELRQEIEVALKHYEDCYDGLVDLLAQPASALAPRTKRWAEAKVLSDCISAKIAKLYLYLDDPVHALAQLNKHVARFRELCTRWEMGESTYEYWSWLSKQYRLFADVLDLALRGGFRLPPASLNVATPATALAHPGHYYAMAAQCAVRRRDCFKQIAASDDSTTPSPALAHEQQVDHTEQIVELHTRAYEIFKRFKANRQALALALAISTVHSDAGHHDLALRFNERIQRTHRLEGWLDTLKPLLQSSLRSARALGNGPTAISCAAELLALARHSGASARIEAARTELLEALEIAPAEGQSSVVSVDVPDMLPLRACATFKLSLTKPVDCEASFELDEAVLGQNVPLLVTLRAGPGFSIGVEIAALKLKFGETHEEISVVPAASSDGVWLADTVVTSSSSQTVTLASVVLVLKSAQWTVELPLVPRRPRAAFDLIELRGPALPPSCAFAPRPLRASLDVETDAVTLLGMRSPIRIVVRNDDDQPIVVTGDALLQPGDDDDDALEHGEMAPARALSAIAFGTVEAGASLALDLALFCASAPGQRLVDLVVRCAPVGEEASAAPVELARSLQIEARAPLLADVDVRWLRRVHVPHGMADTTRPTPMDESWLAALSVRLTVASPGSIDIVNVRPEHADSTHFKVLSSSLTGDRLPLTWERGHRFALVMTVQVAEQHNLGTEQISIDFRRTGSDAAPSTTPIALPPITTPPLLPHVSVAVPPSISQHTPTPLAFRIFNPSRRRLLRLSVSLDGSDGWVFAGPRRTGAFTVLPTAEHVVRVVVIAVGPTGVLALPRLRVFEHVRPGEETQAERLGAAVADGGEQQQPQPVLRELPIVVENADGGRGLSVMVMPH